MRLDNQLIAYVVLALLVALVVSFLMTPVVKTFAYKVGAIDVPKDARRMHKVPFPGWEDWPSSSASWSVSCCLRRSPRR